MSAKTPSGCRKTAASATNRRRPPTCSEPVEVQVLSSASSPARSSRAVGSVSRGAQLRAPAPPGGRRVPGVGGDEGSSCETSPVRESGRGLPAWLRHPREPFGDGRGAHVFIGFSAAELERARVQAVAASPPAPRSPRPSGRYLLSVRPVAVRNRGRPDGPSLPQRGTRSVPRSGGFLRSARERPRTSAQTHCACRRARRCRSRSVRTT